MFKATAGDDFAERPDGKAAQSMGISMGISAGISAGISVSVVCLFRQGFRKNREQIRRVSWEAGFETIGDEVHALFQLQWFQSGFQSSAEMRHGKWRMHTFHAFGDAPHIGIRKMVF